jgi:hypothetical protein
MADYTMAGDAMEPPPLPMDDWYYVERGVRKGPVSTSAIKDMIARKVLEPDDQIWRKGMKEWQSIRNSELSDLVEAEPPPVSGEHINNTLVWVLAFLPLVFGIIDAALASGPEVQVARALALGIGQDFTPPHVPWLIPLLFNVALGLWDERWLKNAGHSDKWMRGFAVFLMPVYLFVRAKRLKQRPWYGLVWVGCFVLSICIAADV